MASSLVEEEWEKRLRGYKDEKRLMDIIRFGVVVMEGEVAEMVDCPNYKSFDEGGEAVDSVLRDEVERGWIVPWVAPHKPRIISARGAIPKADSPELRLITDLSRPRGLSVNDYISVTHFKMHTVDMAMGWMRPGCWMFKIDIRHAYRNIPIHPSNWDVTAFRWLRQLWMDLRLSFGLRSAPEIFGCFGHSIVWMMKQEDWDKIAAYVDDFFSLEWSVEKAWEKFSALWKLLTDLGFPINDKPGKVCRPTQEVKFLGIVLNSLSMTASLAPEKIEKIKRWGTNFVGKKKARVKEVQKLVGLLNHAAKVVRGGRTFLRRMIDCLRGRPKNHHIKLTPEFHEDLRWWLEFVEEWNGVEVIYEDKPLSTCSFQSDAATSGGCAAFFEGDDLFVGQTEDLPKSINALEVYPILLAARKWGNKWEGRVILVLSDNTTAVSAINKGTTDSPIIMKWLRELFWLSAKQKFEVRAVHLPGEHNVLADLLSRGKVEEYEAAKELWWRARNGEDRLWDEVEWLKAMRSKEEEGIRLYRQSRGLRS